MDPSTSGDAISKANKRSRSYIKLTPAQRADLIKQIQSGEDWDNIMESFSISRSTIYFYKDKIKNPAGRVKKKYIKSKKPGKGGKMGLWMVEDAASGSQDMVDEDEDEEEKPKNLMIDATKAEPSTSQSGDGFDSTEVDVKPPSVPELSLGPPAPRAAALRASMEIRMDNEFLEGSPAPVLKKGKGKPGPKRRSRKKQIDSPLVGDLASGLESGSTSHLDLASTSHQTKASTPMSSVPLVVAAGLTGISKRGGNRRGKAVKGTTGKPVRPRNRGGQGSRKRSKHVIEINKAEDDSTGSQITGDHFSGIQFDPLTMASPSVGSIRRVNLTPASFSQSRPFTTLNLIRTPSFNQAVGFSNSSNISRPSEEQYESMNVEGNMSESFMTDDSRAGPSQQRDPLNPGFPPHTPRTPNQLHVQHNYHSRRVMEALVNDEAFVDVTLTAEGRPISAHKLVLSAMSPYFQRVLQANPCKHPVVIMPPSVSFAHLSHIISFMYKGETTVLESDLRSLIRTAELLQVSGFRVAPGQATFTGDSPASSSSFSGFSNPANTSAVDDRVIRITEERDASDEENFGTQNLSSGLSANQASSLRRQSQPGAQSIHTPVGTRIIHTTPNPLVNPFTSTPPQNTSTSAIPAKLFLTPSGNPILVNSRTGTIISAPNTPVSRTSQPQQRTYIHRPTGTIFKHFTDNRVNRPNSPDLMNIESSVLGAEEDIDIIKEELPNDDEEDSTVFVMEDWSQQQTSQPATSSLLANPLSPCSNPLSALSPQPSTSAGLPQTPAVGVSVSGISSAIISTPTGMISPSLSTKSKTPPPDARIPSPAAGTSSAKSRSPTPAAVMSPCNMAVSPKSRSPTPVSMMSVCPRSPSPMSRPQTPTNMTPLSDKTLSPMVVLPPPPVTSPSPPSPMAVTPSPPTTPPPPVTSPSPLETSCTSPTPSSTLNTLPSGTPPSEAVTRMDTEVTSEENVDEAPGSPTPPPPPAITPPTTGTKLISTPPGTSDDITPPSKPATLPTVEMTPPDSNTSPPSSNVAALPVASAFLTSTSAPLISSPTSVPAVASPICSPPSTSPTTKQVAILSPTPTPEPVVSPITDLPRPPKDLSQSPQSKNLPSQNSHSTKSPQRAFSPIPPQTLHSPILSQTTHSPNSPQSRHSPIPPQNTFSPISPQTSHSPSFQITPSPLTSQTSLSFTPPQNTQPLKSPECLHSPIPSQSRHFPLPPQNTYSPISPHRYSPISPHSHTSIPSYTHSPIPPHSHTPIPPYTHSPIPSHSHSPIPPHSHSPIPPHSHSPIPPHSHSPIPPHSHSPVPSHSHSPISSHSLSPVPSHTHSPIRPQCTHSPIPHSHSPSPGHSSTSRSPIPTNLATNLTPSVRPSFKQLPPKPPTTAVFPFNIGSRPFTITPLSSASKSSKYDRSRDPTSHSPVSPRGKVFNSSRGSSQPKLCPHHANEHNSSLSRHTTAHHSHFSTASPSPTTTSSMLTTPHLATGMPAKSGAASQHTPLLDLSTRCPKHGYQTKMVSPPSTARSSLSPGGVTSLAPLTNISKGCSHTSTPTKHPLLTTSEPITTPVASPTNRPMRTPSRDTGRCPHHSNNRSSPQTVASAKPAAVPPNFNIEYLAARSGSTDSSSMPSSSSSRNRLYDMNTPGNSLNSQLTMGAPTATLVSDDVASQPPTPSSYYMDSHHMASPMPPEPMDYDLHSLQQSVTLYDLDNHAQITPVPLRPDPTYNNPVAEQNLYGYPSTSHPPLPTNYDPAYMQPHDSDNSYNSFSPPTYFNFDSTSSPLPSTVASPSSYDAAALNPTDSSSVYREGSPSLTTLNPSASSSLYREGSPSLAPLQPLNPSASSSLYREGSPSLAPLQPINPSASSSLYREGSPSLMPLQPLNPTANRSVYREGSPSLAPLNPTPSSSVYREGSSSLAPLQPLDPTASSSLYREGSPSLAPLNPTASSSVYREGNSSLAPLQPLNPTASSSVYREGSPSLAPLQPLNPTASSVYREGSPSVPHAGSPLLQHFVGGESTGMYGHPPLANSPHPNPYFLDRAMSTGSAENAPSPTAPQESITYALKKFRK